MIYRKLFLAVLVFVSGLPLLAQVKEEPKERNVSIEEPVIFKDSLPKISLPDFVITGKEKIDIANRNKIEFIDNRTYVLSKELSPEFDVKDVSTTAIETPIKRTNIFGEDNNIFSGFVKGEYGNFNSAAFSTGAAYRYNIFKAALTGNYLSRGENVKNSNFSKGDIDLSIAADIPKTDNIFNQTKVKLDIGYNARAYNFYGKPSASTIIIYPIPLADKLPENTTAYNIKASISSENAKYFKYYLKMAFNNFEDKKDFAMADFTENGIQINTGGSYEYEKILFSMNLYYNGYNVKKDNYYSIEEKRSPSLWGFDLAASKEVYPSIFADAGLKFLFYDFYLPSYEKGDKRDNLILPQISIRYENNKDFSISINYRPDFELMNIEKLFSINPYIYPVQANHIINNVNLFTKVDYTNNNDLNIKATFGYIEKKNTPFFQAPEYISSHIQLFRAEMLYEKAKGIYCNLHFDYAFRDKSSIALKLNYQNLRVESAKIPYTPDFYGSLEYYKTLSIGLSLNPSIEFIGERRTDQLYKYTECGGPIILSNTLATEKAIFLLNLNMEYPILKNLIASADLNNILNTRYFYYSGYEEYPFSIFAGIKFKW